MRECAGLVHACSCVSILVIICCFGLLVGYAALPYRLRHWRSAQTYQPSSLFWRWRLRINHSVFVSETERVYCAVRSAFLHTIFFRSVRTNPGARSRRRLMFVSPLYKTSFMTPFWGLEFCDDSQIFGKFVRPWFTKKNPRFTRYSMGPFHAVLQ